MIIYKALKHKFLSDVETGNIGDIVYEEYQKRIGKAAATLQISWQNSLRYMYEVLNKETIPSDSTICIEYRLPNQNNRIDFIIAGKNKDNEENVVIIELKQWQTASAVDGKKEIVSTYINGSEKEVAHPSYQAWSYAVTLNEYNEAVRKDNIKLFPCAYLHNYSVIGKDPVINPDVFRIINEAPLFTQSNSANLSNFISERISGPDDKDIMHRIDNGRIKPSKSLQDMISSIMKNNQEFVLIDNQKVIYENLMYYIHRIKNESEEKKVFIIEGGPGTGKSVLAINLLASVIQDGKSCAYVSKNAAPRNVYEAKLTADHYKKALIHASFKGSGSFVDARKNQYDVLIVDEAHRLNEKSGLYSNLGENQIKEIINASKLSIFFIDENQMVHAKDIGTVNSIRQFAKMAGANILTSKLESQFRCNGSDGYLCFLDDLLGIRETLYTFDPSDYDIQVIDDPNEMFSMIKQKNLKSNKARMVAGYCWNWQSKKDSNIYDIVISEYDFKATWNYNNTTTWAIDEESVDQVGCIHTSQGLEFEYIGVLIGDDLRYENGCVITDYKSRAKTDQSLKGLVTHCNKGNLAARDKADKIIRNTYRTLLSRAMKGCYIYCTDKALGSYLKSRIEENRNSYLKFESSSKSI